MLVFGRLGSGELLGQNNTFRGIEVNETQERAFDEQRLVDEILAKYSKITLAEIISFYIPNFIAEIENVDAVRIYGGDLFTLVWDGDIITGVSFAPEDDMYSISFELLDPQQQFVKKDAIVNITARIFNGGSIATEINKHIVVSVANGLMGVFPLHIQIINGVGQISVVLGDIFPVGRYMIPATHKYVHYSYWKVATGEYIFNKFKLRDAAPIKIYCYLENTTPPA
jgi:hypothetical protein